LLGLPRCRTCTAARFQHSLEDHCSVVISLSLVLALTLAVDDPRVDLVRLQLTEGPEAALAQTEQLLESRPDWAHQWGLGYLRAEILDFQGRTEDATEAFAAALSSSPSLEPFSRFRLALEQEEQDHPEVAAGLVATLLSKGPPRSLAPKATSLLRETLARGGDCRLLSGLETSRFAKPERRQLNLAKALCALQSGQKDQALQGLLSLLREDKGDEAAREAVEWVASLQQSTTSTEVRNETSLLIGMTFHQHREFPRAILYLDAALKRFERSGSSLPASQDFAARYALQRSHFWLNDFDRAGKGFLDLSKRTRIPKDRAKAIYQAARCFELAGDWQTAADHYRLAYNAEPAGNWADAGLFAALRLEWRTGNDEAALELFRLLRTKRGWQGMAARAALFLASSDLVQGRSDRVHSWLTFAEGADRGAWYEAQYWHGRSHELKGDPKGALERYLRLLRRSRHHPLAQAALRRIHGSTLASTAKAEGSRLASSTRSMDLHSAWILLGDRDPLGSRSRIALLKVLQRDRQAAPFLSMEPVPVEGWPLWQGTLRQPEEFLLALGIWREGASVMRRHFPIQNSGLAFTSSQLLASTGEVTHSLRIAEILAQRIPSRVPFDLLPTAYKQLLYPDAYSGWIRRQSLRFGVEPALLQGIIREESRFNPTALSGASARGLTQFVMPTARELAVQLDLGRLEPKDLYRPPVAITLGAAYVSQLHERFATLRPAAVAAYNAGEPQAALWQRYCFSQEPEEYITKVGFRQTRNYLRKVLTSYSSYQSIYSP